jgi:CheY-like chemotaxis protein
MPKRVLSVGQCAADDAAIARLIERNFDATVVPVPGTDEALAALRAARFDLRAIKADPQFRAAPVMLVTNYTEHQQAAIEAGAEPGFGKLEYDRPETRAKLARFLE